MQLAIKHLTRYNYSSAVFLEPHFLHFFPLQTPFLSVQKFNLALSPSAAGTTFLIDEFGNNTHHVWFNGQHPSLQIEAEIILKSSAYNFFDFIIYPERYNEINPKNDFPLKEYIKPAFTDSLLTNFYNSISKKNTTDFITSVCKTIYDEFEKTERKTGKPQSPEITLQKKSGTCRDFTVLMNETIKLAGFATRFVSGYYYDEDRIGNNELHAWSEVFIPGAGWKGFDPSTGLVVNNHYIAVAAAPNPEHTLPVTGTFRGNANTEIFTEISIKPI
jgi:transglutaminase-like putative cysteine protease